MSNLVEKGRDGEKKGGEDGPKMNSIVLLKAKSTNQ